MSYILELSRLIGSATFNLWELMSKEDSSLSNEDILKVLDASLMLNQVGMLTDTEKVWLWKHGLLEI